MDDYKEFDSEKNDKKDIEALEKTEQEIEHVLVYPLEEIINSLSESWSKNNIRLATRDASALEDFPFSGLESEVELLKESNLLDVIGDIIEFGPDNESNLILVSIIFSALTKIIKVFPFFAGSIYKAEIINRIFISPYRLDIEAIINMLEFIKLLVSRLKTKYFIGFCNDCFHYQLCYLMSTIKDYQIQYLTMDVLCQIFDLMIENRVQMNVSIFFKVISQKLLPNLILESNNSEDLPIISLVFHFLEAVFDAYSYYQIEDEMAHNFIEFYNFSDSIKIGQSVGCFLKLLKQSHQDTIIELIDHYGIEKLSEYLDSEDQEIMTNTISVVLYIACVCGPCEIINILLDRIIDIADDIPLSAKHAMCQSISVAIDTRNLEFCKWLIEGGIITLVMNFIINYSEDKCQLYAMSVLRILQFLNQNGLSEMFLNVAIENDWNDLLEDYDGDSEALEEIKNMLNVLSEE